MSWWKLTSINFTREHIGKKLYIPSKYVNDINRVSGIIKRFLPSEFGYDVNKAESMKSEITFYNKIMEFSWVVLDTEVDVKVYVSLNVKNFLRKSITMREEICM
jgi:hypothetical protein